MILKHLELFAGIGGFRKALDLLGNDFNLGVKCVGFSEKDPYAVRTYKSNFNTEGETEIGDIVNFTKYEDNIKALPDFDLLTGGFPCQSFSMMGKQLGFDDDRGNLFFNILDILRIKQPRYVLLENVKNLKTHDNSHTFNEIIKKLRDLGYHISADIFNSNNFALAQKRNRVFIFASKDAMPFGFDFSEPYIKSVFKPLNGETSIIRHKNVLDVLSKNVPSKYYLSEKIKPTILADGSKNFISKSEINPLIARPLTATMVKMHRACQDNYYSDNFLNAENPISFSKQFFTKEELRHQKIRKITPEEAFALQGFDNVFYQNAVNAGLSDHQLYKQAGNAVSVNTVYAILYYLFIHKQLLDSSNYAANKQKTLVTSRYGLTLSF
jgi:DNA (cytosine-5)-methyltransferase 1